MRAWKNRLRTARRSISSDAYYDSNSAFAYVPRSDLYGHPPASEPRQLREEDFELQHELAHWIQHCSTGLGALLNELRRHRDYLLLGEIFTNADLKARARARLVDGAVEPLFTVPTIEATLAGVLEGTVNVAWGFYWAEKLLSSPEHAQWNRSSDALLFLSLLYASEGKEGVARAESANVQRFLSSPHTATKSDARFFSTDQICESISVVIEALLANLAGFKSFGQRSASLVNTDYCDALSFIFGYMQFPQKMIISRSVDIFFSSLAILECSLDIYGPPFGSIDGITRLDIYPPSRLAALIVAAKEIDLLHYDAETQPREVDDYKSALCRRAGIRRSSEISSADRPRKFAYSKLLYDQRNSGLSVLVPDDFNHDFYDYLAFLQSVAQQTRNTECLLYSTDMFCALAKCGVLDPRLIMPTDDVADFYFFPILLYEDHKLGVHPNRGLFSKALFKASAQMYTVFSIATDKGPVRYSAEDHNYGLSGSETFAALERAAVSVTSTL